MKNLILLVIVAFACLVPGLRAQQLVRQFPFSASHGMHINHSTSDNEGNVLVCGYFTGNSASLNGYPLQAARPLPAGVSSYRLTAFVAKLSPSGTVQWAVPFHQNKFFRTYWTLDTLSNGQAMYYLAPVLSFSRVMVNAQNDVFVVGHCEGDSLFWGGNVLPFEVHPKPFYQLSHHITKVLALRISSAGDVSWVRALETPVPNMQTAGSPPLVAFDAALTDLDLNILVQGRVEKSYPSGFSSSSNFGIRFISIRQNGNYQGEGLVEPFVPSPSNPSISEVRYPLYRPGPGPVHFFPLSLNWGGANMRGLVLKSLNGQLAGIESLRPPLPPTDWGEFRIFSFIQDSDSGITLSTGQFFPNGTPDSIWVFNTPIPRPNTANFSSYQMVRFSNQGCLEWVKTILPVYQLTPDGQGNLVGIEPPNDSLSLNHVEPIKPIVTHHGQPDFYPRGLYHLVKYNAKGNLVFRKPLSEFTPTDTAVAWRWMGGSNYENPIFPLSISRIKGDTITVAGGKFVCHFVDQSADSSFAITPPSCTPREFFRNTVTAIRPTSRKGEPELYPNPARQQLTLAGLGREVRSLPVQDALGRRFTLGVQQGTVDVSSLHPGVYFIRVQGTVKRFVKE